MSLVHKSRAKQYARNVNPFGLSGNAPYLIGGALLIAGFLYFSRDKNGTEGRRFYALKGSADPFFEGRYVINFDKGKSLVLYDSGKAELLEPGDVVPSGESSRVFNPFGGIKGENPAHSSDDINIFALQTRDGKDFGLLRVSASKSANLKSPEAYAEIFSRSAEPQAVLEEIPAQRFFNILLDRDPKWVSAKHK